MAAPLEHTLLAITFDRHPDHSFHSKVPPHVTVMPWFEAGKPIVHSLIDYAIGENPPFAIRRGGPMTAGAEGHEKASAAVVSDELLRLHGKLFSVLVSQGVEFDHPQWLGHNYTPHYRVREDQDPFSETDEIQVAEIAVIRNVAVSGLDKGVKEISYRRLGWMNGRA